MRLIVLASVLFLASLVPAGAADSGTPDGRVVLYLHGKIVEDQGAEAKSERFGPYEYRKIVEALGRDGARVISEIRPPNTKVEEYARKVVQQIEKLKADGTPSGKITVIGASKGAAMAVHVSHLLGDRDVRFVLLATCSEETIEYWKSRGICLTGKILAIHDASDTIAGSCREILDICGQSVTGEKEIRLEMGVRHGLVYRPYEEWVAPALEWSRRGAPDSP